MAVIEHEIQTIETKPSLRDLMERAAELIEERDLCQGQMRQGNSLCILEALRVASREFGFSPPSIPGYHELSERVGENIVHWNDTEGRTKEEVIALLREAA